MILADTSIWIRHLRTGEPELERLLNVGQVLMHPHIVAELSLGSLKNRADFLRSAAELPQVQVASHSELLHFIDTKKLFSTGIGFVDAHLLASAMLSNARLWTADTNLRTASIRLNVAYEMEH